MSDFPVGDMTAARAALMLLALLARATGGEQLPPAGGKQEVSTDGEQAQLVGRKPVLPAGKQSCPDGEHKYQVSPRESYCCVRITELKIPIQTKDKKVVIRPGPDDNSVTVKCEGNGILEALEAPKDKTVLCPTQPTTINLMNCSPAGGCLKEVLAKLNISVDSLRYLELQDLPPGSTLREDLFLGLDHLLRLKLTTPQSSSNTVISKSGFLGPLHTLQELELQSVPLQPEELNNLAKTLRSLSLQNTGVYRLPEQLMTSEELVSLTVKSARPLDAGAVPPALAHLELESPNTTLRLASAANLPRIFIKNWSDWEPKPLETCNNLTSLILHPVTLKSLPKDWLKNCSLLQTLKVSGAKNLTSLPDTMFANPSSIENISFTYCGLETFPKTLLINLTNLTELILYNNRLKMLPSSMFSGVSGLTRLDLSGNLLGKGSDLGIASVQALADLTSLTWLRLESNPLGDLCSNNTEKSPLQKSMNLKRLILSKTRVSRMCADWRLDFTRLVILDLRHTLVRELWYTDLEFNRDVDDAIVFLDDTNINRVGMTTKEYLSVNKTKYNNIQVQLDNNISLACDCDMYWTRHVLQNFSNLLEHVRQLSNLKCENGKTLQQTDPGDMLCGNKGNRTECSDENVPAGCVCGWRPEGDPNFDISRVRLNCSNHGRAGYLQLPPQNESRRYELLLEHNNISELPLAALRSDIVKLDLSSNVLKTANETTVKKLYNFTGKLLLAENKLDCSCSNALLLAVLAWRRNKSLDPPEFAADCEDGSKTLSAPTEGCGPRNATWLAAALAVLFALTLAAVTIFWSPERRLFFKALLHHLGLWRPKAAEADDDRPYDAFVTFSHKDEARVLELVARLEPPYRLCVHYRDWVPGRYITEQIAESVAGSRRTIALVSRHFLESGWALAEFRQAHAATMLEARPRLVVVLLEDPATLRLDAQLRRYLATNTYVRWGDPWLWDKLALALPRPRASLASTNGTVSDPCPNTSAKAPDSVPAAVASRRPTVTSHRAVATSRSSGTRSLTSTENSMFSSPVVTSSRPALRRSPADTAVTMVSGNAAVSSSGVSELSASTAELELTPLCLAPKTGRSPQPARDRPPPARSRMTHARIEPPPDRRAMVVTT